MRPLITLFILSFTTACFAQKQNVYFLKNDGRYVQDRDSADYMRIVREPDSASVLYNISEFYMNGKKKSVGQSSVIDPPHYEGTRICYYKNEHKQSITNYKNNIEVGDYFEYYPNGKPYLEIKYPEIPELFNNAKNNYLIIAAYDSSGTKSVTEGNGYCKMYDSKLKNIVDEGNLKNGKREGVWKGYDPGFKLNFHETYDNGNLLKGVAFDANGDSVEYKGSRATAPDYKGGIKGFSNYLSKNIFYPDYERAHDIQGKVILSFIVETNGKVSNIKILKSVSKNIDEEAEKIISNAPGWISGTEYGRKVRSYFTQPINFALTN